jgi:hypothetical protein
MTMTRFLLGILLLTSGCASTIPNTDVRDTPGNRQVLEFMERYREAVNERDVGKILAMTSPKYLDDMGTPDGADDLDFDRLRERLTEWSGRVHDVRYDIRYRRVTYEMGRIFVEFTYRASFELANPGEEKGKWSRRIGDHRAILVRNEADDDFAFVSGL